MTYGPSRTEHKFWLIFSILGLCLLIFAISYRGLGGPAFLEIGVFGGGFFIFMLIRSLRALMRSERR